jgi:DNA helicase HerA-like ATPase
MSAVSRASEAVSQDLLDDLPGLNVGEAVVVGQLTRTPVMVKVSGRISEEGGSDINVIEELAKARRDAETDTSIEKFIKEDLEELREAEA